MTSTPSPGGGAAPAEWTLLVYLNAKNDLEPYAFGNFEQMANVGSTDKVNVLVEFGRPKNNYIGLYGGWSKTLRFRVTQGQEPREQNALMDLGDVNMGAPETLEDFVTWGKQNYPAKRTMLVVWDHGQGWRVPTATRIPGLTGADEPWLVAHGARMRAEGASAIPPNMRIAGSHRYVSHDEDTGDKLYNKELQQALEGATAGAPLDIVAYDACLMAMIETAWSLRRVAGVMVGSEELEPGAGWNYQRWLERLVADPAAFDAETLARAVVDGYADEYGNDAATTLSAIRIADVEGACDALSELADALRDDMDANVPAIAAARDDCANYAPGYGLNSIDLVRFLERLRAQPGLSAGVSDLARVARADVLDSVITAYASTKRRGDYGSKGLAIYFPRTGHDFKVDPDRGGYNRSNSHYPVDFVKDHQWSRLLKAYYKRVPN